MRAQNRYVTSRLQGIASALGLEDKIEALGDGDYRDGGMAYAGFPLHVVVDEGKVSHIGWKLPIDGGNPLVSRFVERAALEKALYKADKLPVEWNTPDQAFYSSGAIENVLNADADNIIYSCALSQGRQYQASWATPGGNVLCVLVFPANYELISGANIREMEAELFAALSKAEAIAEPLVGLGKPSLREEGEEFTVVSGPELPGSLLVNAVYVKDEGGRDSLIFDRQLPIESLANAMSSTVSSRGIKANVKMMAYGAGSRRFSLPLSALVGYFLKQGCIPYFGLMDGSAAGDEIVAAVKMANPELGYIHLMKVTASPEALFGAEPYVDITLAAYVNDKTTQEPLLYE